MAFKQIGTLARTVLREAELAAAAHKTQRKGSDEPEAKGFNPGPSPMLEAGGGVPTEQTVNEVPVSIAPYTGKRGGNPAATTGRANVAGGREPGMEKTRGTGGDPATRVWEECQQSGEASKGRSGLTYGNHTVTALRLSRCERIANPRPGAISPVAAMRSHLLSEWLHAPTDFLRETL